jgi:hypothetical protein
VGASLFAAGGLARGVAPSACVSLDRVKSFHGTAHMGFSSIATGQDPSQGPLGSEEVGLYRSASPLDLTLGKKVVFGSDVVFSGRIHGGSVDISDDFHTSDGSGTDLSGSERYSGPPQPDGSGAALYVNTHTCTYQLQISVQVGTTFIGSEERMPDDAVANDAAYSPRKHVPASLKLVGSVESDAYYTCPGNPLRTGEDCHQVSGGWATEFAMLKVCGSNDPKNCDPADEPVGTAGLVWSLAPTYKH